MDLIERALEFEQRKRRSLSTSDRVKIGREAKELILSLNEVYKKTKDDNMTRWGMICLHNNNQVVIVVVDFTPIRLMYLIHFLEVGVVETLIVSSHPITEKEEDKHKVLI